MNIFLLLFLVLILIILVVIVTIVNMKNNESRYRPVNLNRDQLGGKSSCIIGESYPMCSDYKYSFTHVDSCAKGNTPCSKTQPASGRQCTWDTDKNMCKNSDIRCQDKSAIENKVETCITERNSYCTCESGNNPVKFADSLGYMCSVCE